MGDWTSQNWTKRDRRNNQEEQQEKKATYVKDCSRAGSQKVRSQTFCRGKILYFILFFCISWISSKEYWRNSKASIHKCIKFHVQHFLQVFLQFLQLFDLLHFFWFLIRLQFFQLSLQGFLQLLQQGSLLKGIDENTVGAKGFHRLQPFVYIRSPLSNTILKA